MKKTTKRILSMLVVLTMILSMLPAASVFAKTKSYKAYLGFQTDTQLWIFRNAYDAKDFGYKTSQFKNGLYSTTTKKHYAGTFKDATIKKNGTYSVSLSNPDLQSEKHISCLFVSTNIPLSKHVKVTNVKVAFNGTVKKTWPKAYLNPESEKYVQILCLNSWNPKVKDCFTYPMPFDKVVITFTIKNLK